MGKQRKKNARGSKLKRVIKVSTREANLKRRLRIHLKSLGFKKSNDGRLLPPGEGKDAIRALHLAQRTDRIKASRTFIDAKLPDLLKYFASVSEIDPALVKPRLELIKSGGWQSELFRLASLTWAVPVSNGFGRRLRYLVWDGQNNKLIGVIAIGDPVFNLSARDNLIGWTGKQRASRLVNIMDAYVLGALPPYNMLLGGKLIASLIRTRDLYKDFAKAYGDTTGIISHKKKKARLLVVTTSSSLGRSSVYNRVKLGETLYLKPIGFTRGLPPSGTVEELDIIDTARPNNYYRGRWTKPRNHSGTYIARRDREYGAAIWGLPIALTQYAPGKQIWISGKCYTSGAIYSVMSADRFQAWEAKRIYQECSICGFAKTDTIENIPRGTKGDCVACGSTDTFGPARYWLRPPGFAHPKDTPEVTSPDEIPETSYATRAKLTMETPADTSRWAAVSERVRILRERQHLLVSNTGPKKEGYSYCTKCGRIEATSEQTATLFASHSKPYIDDKEPMCEGTWTSAHIVLGTDFITDIALLSMTVAAPLRLRPGQYPTDVALRTVSEAVAKAGSQMLEIETGELMAEYRPALTPSGQSGLEAEVFLYDTLAGGAGFSSQLVDRGEELMRRASELLKNCPGHCETSCYRCLRSFKNKFEHYLLDRHVGAELLDYLVTGIVPQFDRARLKKSTGQLFADLLRQDKPGMTFERDKEVTVGGKKYIVPILGTKGTKQVAIGLSGPLTPDFPADEALVLLRKTDFPVFVINELLVRGSLPTATLSVQQSAF